MTARGFTLIELLVVIFIIGLLVALTLPAVLGARESSRRSHCANNLRQIGFAMQQHLEATDSFPPGGIEWRPPGNSSKRQLAWCVFLLPYLEQQSVYDQLDLKQAFDSPRNAPAAATILPVFICPSGPRGAQRVAGRGPTDYGGIYGERIKLQGRVKNSNQPPKGIMIYDQRFTSGEIRDGLSNTLIVAEDTGSLDGQWINAEDTSWRDRQWINGRNLFDQAYPINAAPKNENDIRSEHPGGAQGVFASGAVRFLDEDIDLNILAALCTRAGGEPLGSF